MKNDLIGFRKCDVYCIILYECASLCHVHDAVEFTIYHILALSTRLPHRPLDLSHNVYLITTSL